MKNEKISGGGGGGGAPLTSPQGGVMDVGL